MINPSASTHEMLYTNDNPEHHLQTQHDKKLIHSAIEQLAPEFREVIILRELEELSYNDIAVITQCAMGTVMSRLSRARQQLKKILQRTSQNMENQA